MGFREGGVTMKQPLPPSQVTVSAIRTEPSLYRRLGGYDVIAAIIDNVMERLRTDPRFSRRAIPGDDAARRGRHRLVGQMCELSGGPCIYIGRGMKLASDGLGITERDWKATRKYMARTLSDLHVARKESEEVIALWTRHKAEILDSASVG
jgi:hemoglobin